MTPAPPSGGKGGPTNKVAVLFGGRGKKKRPARKLGKPMSGRRY